MNAPFTFDLSSTVPLDVIASSQGATEGSAFFIRLVDFDSIFMLDISLGAYFLSLLVSLLLQIVRSVAYTYSFSL